MIERRLDWDGYTFVHRDMTGEVCHDLDDDKCIDLVDDYPGLSRNTFTWRRSVWESLAESILFEKKRREEEAKPERWYVYRSAAGGWAAELALSQDCNDGNMYVADGQVTHVWLWAKDEKEAITKARELAVSVNVLTQEYLRP